MRKYRYETAIDEFLKDNDECLWAGYREDDVAKTTAAIPVSGECRIDQPALEKFRQLQNLYYDIYNNGGGNAIDMNVDCRDDREHWGMSKSTMQKLRANPAELERRTQSALDDAIVEIDENVFTTLRDATLPMGGTQKPGKEDDRADALRGQIVALQERVNKLEGAIKAQIAANPKGSYPCLHYALKGDA
jgi:hypothetical protein